ncbi:hypothetical protein [Leifsonia sp. C5G2]|uniref:hypothetical protein n=1 Tax=Leifsonia sp. C5G2 TaxID=2735269 RepID=UPI0015856C54|nr:hypothetical protein [Leifsonia sp. C5G2]NUU05213.1 hypothetical protein [Leifsonia sp. C5G2]
MSEQATNDDSIPPGTLTRQPISRRSVVGILGALAVGAFALRDWSTPGVAEAAPAAQAVAAPPSYQGIIGLL